MKHHTFITAIITTLLFVCVAYTSCKKDPCAVYSCYNNGTCSGGNCVCPTGFTGVHCEKLATTYISFKNNMFTAASIVFNENLQSIPVGGTATFAGSYGTKATGTATTFATYGSYPLGEHVQYALIATFPISDTLYQSLDVPAPFFYLEVVNKSANTINGVYTNYGLSNQTFDNVNVPNDSLVHPLCYYYNASTVTLITTSVSSTTFTLSLVPALNQVVKLTVN